LAGKDVSNKKKPLKGGMKGRGKNCPGIAGLDFKALGQKFPKEEGSPTRSTYCLGQEEKQKGAQWNFGIKSKKSGKKGRKRKGKGVVKNASLG